MSHSLHGGRPIRSLGDGGISVSYFAQMWQLFLALLGARWSCKGGHEACDPMSLASRVPIINGKFFKSHIRTLLSPQNNLTVFAVTLAVLTMTGERGDLQ